jgi:toxin ParE1/3/4
VRIVTSPEAQADLREAYDYIARDNPEAADRLLERIAEIVEVLASGLVEGREVRLRSGRKVRAWAVPPYRIYYSIRGDDFEIVRIYHQARRPIEG